MITVGEPALVARYLAPVLEDLLIQRGRRRSPLAHRLKRSSVACRAAAMGLQIVSRWEGGGCAGPRD